VSADQKKTQTISLKCGVTHSPGKIEYNCRYFIMTFRTQIHKKKFDKCFRNLQGTMSHCPLTNTSSLKSLQLTLQAYQEGLPPHYSAY
jgi:hypothetical protein